MGVSLRIRGLRQMYSDFIGGCKLKLSLYVSGEEFYLFFVNGVPFQLLDILDLVFGWRGGG